MKLSKTTRALSTVGLVLVILLVLLCFGGVGPIGWHPYTYGPVGIILIILVVLLVTGNL